MSLEAAVTPKGHNMKKLISIITPCYNEEDNIDDCYGAVRAIFENVLRDYDYEHIFCDNASSDNTLKILRELAGKDSRIKVIVNSRNYGPFRSTFNGLMNSRGDAVLVLLAADLQDPPEMLKDFVIKWEEGYQIVYGIRKEREENRIMSSVRKTFYRVVNRFADFHIPLDAGEFQLVDKVVIEALRGFEDYYPYIRGMIASCGFKSTGIGYVWKARKKGFSKNRIYHLIDQGLNGIISFSSVPLRISMLLGFLLSGLSIFYAFMQFLINLIFFRMLAPPGIATLIVAVFFFSGVQLFFIGLLGEYIGAIHSQVRKKPLVIEKERINFKE